MQSKDEDSEYLIYSHTECRDNYKFRHYIFADLHLQSNLRIYFLTLHSGPQDLIYKQWIV